MDLITGIEMDMRGIHAEQPRPTWEEAVARMLATEHKSRDGTSFTLGETPGFGREWIEGVLQDSIGEAWKDDWAAESEEEGEEDKEDGEGGEEDEDAEGEELHRSLRRLLDGLVEYGLQSEGEVDGITDSLARGETTARQVLETWGPRLAAAQPSAALEVGLLVEIHSLSHADLNGKQGYCTAWDAAKERWGVALVSTTRALAVRPANLRAAAPPSPKDAESAAEMAYEAARLLSEARQKGADGAAALTAQAEARLAASEARDPACSVMLQLRGDLAHMRGSHERMAIEMHRAVANCRGSREEKLSCRMGLANALGEAGDAAGEEAQLRAVLRIAPSHIHARFALGSALSQSAPSSEPNPRPRQPTQPRVCTSGLARAPGPSVVPKP